MVSNFYALRFYDSQKSKLIILPIEVSSIVSLDKILETVVISSHRLSFRPLYGTIREVSVVDGKKKQDFISCVNTGKKQVFVFKRFGDILSQDDEKIMINGEEIGENLKIFYDNVNIIELN